MAVSAPGAWQRVKDYFMMSEVDYVQAYSALFKGNWMIWDHSLFRDKTSGYIGDSGNVFHVDSIYDTKPGSRAWNDFTWAIQTPILGILAGAADSALKVVTLALCVVVLFIFLISCKPAEIKREFRNVIGAGRDLLNSIFMKTVFFGLGGKYIYKAYKMREFSNLSNEDILKVFNKGWDPERRNRCLSTSVFRALRNIELICLSRFIEDFEYLVDTAKAKAPG